MTTLRRILALTLPNLLEELVAQQTLQPADVSSAKRRGVSSERRRAPSQQPVSRQPVAIVLTDADLAWDSKTRLDAVNGVARKLGIYPRQTIAEASVRVERLIIRALPQKRVTEALKQI